jgi:DNA-binding transcriptional regulator YdaS (Cro superfamily)
VDEPQLPIAKACHVVGGQAELARALGVTPAAVNQWCKGVRAVPAERCPAVERETRRVAADKGDPGLVVTCESLRPDVEWGVLRGEPRKASARGNWPLTEAELDRHNAEKAAVSQGAG